MGGATAIDPRDLAIQSASPCLMAPRFGRLPALIPGQHRYVAASDGLYVQAASRVLAFTIRLHSMRFPYGDLAQGVVFRYGPPPRGLLSEAQRLAGVRCPNEWAGLIVYSPAKAAYELLEPPVLSSGAGHIRYDQQAVDYDWVLIDMHSHPLQAAYFSATDNDSDFGGLYLACVIGGGLDTDSMTLATRIVCREHFVPVQWNPWTSTHG